MSILRSSELFAICVCMGLGALGLGAALAHADEGATNAPLRASLGERPQELHDDTVDASRGSGDVWSRLRANFALPPQDDESIASELRWLQDSPNFLARVQRRARRYLHFIVVEAQRRGLPGELALLPVVESSFYPFAYSPGRAAGIWQFIPATGRRFGLKQNWWYDGRRDIETSTRAAFDYLKWMHRDLGGDWLLALAGYNAGEARVKRAVERNRKAGKPTDFWSLDLPPETRSYVPRLLALTRIVANPEAYDAKLVPVLDAPYFVSVDVSSQIDLAIAAQMAGIGIEELYWLNPGFNRWATDPDGPHRLLVPKERAESLRLGLKQLPPERRVLWQRHRVTEGETLSHIALRYRTTVSTLRKVNKLKGDHIRTGKHLLIPIASADRPDYALSLEQRIQRIQERKRDGSRLAYAVQPGDTLWDIARAHRVSVRKLATWNGMAPADAIRPGQQLTIWKGKRRPVSRPVSSTEGPSEFAGRQKIRYTVKIGDSLDQISRKFRVNLEDVRRWNRKALRGKYIHPGQKLTLHVDVTRQSL